MHRTRVNKTGDVRVMELPLNLPRKYWHVVDKNFRKYLIINCINMTVKHNNNILNLVTGCLYVSSFGLHVSVNFDHHQVHNS